MQSDDIRSQLPDDSKRFELLDNSWKDCFERFTSAICSVCYQDLMMEAGQGARARSGAKNAKPPGCHSVHAVPVGISLLADC